MTSRERTMLMLLGVFGVLGLVLGGWMLILSPMQDNNRRIDELRQKYTEKDGQLLELNAKSKQLKGFRERSLSGDLDRAKAEYYALLDKLLRDAKVPIGYTVQSLEPADANRVPTIAPKVPAYSRAAFTITLRRVDLPTVVRFLEAYYREPVLHQITKFTMKRTGDVADSGTRRADARADLEVTLVTEALSIEGTPKRLTLLPVPQAFGALGGGIGLALLEQRPEAARGIRPMSVPIRMAAGRDYGLLAAKDPFHGPLPEPKPKEPPKEVVAKTEPPPPPPEDISPFIRLTGITWRSDSTMTAEIRDDANNYDYEVSKRFGLDGDLVVTVRKYYWLNNERKRLDAFDDLVISEEGTATNRTFKVLDFMLEGLLLSETVFVAGEGSEGVSSRKEPSKEPSRGGRPGTGMGSSRMSRPGPKPAAEKPGIAPLAAVAGPMALLPSTPQTKIYLWRVGTPLSRIEEVRSEAKPPPPVADRQARELSPMPREVSEGR